jgi:alkyl sulfatase BDS1-like metallo-beta-lactamase superfamily hydrolase
MLGLALILGGCGDDQQASARTGFRRASAATAAANGAVAELPPLGDQQDRGRHSRASDCQPETAQGHRMPMAGPVEHGGLCLHRGRRPGSVNPSLRQAKLNNINGLFEVTKGVYQLRGFDLANITLIQGKTGWIRGTR